MSKITIYDADAYMRRDHNMACHTFGQVAVFQGPLGVVVAEREAVHDVLASVDDDFTFSLTKIPPAGSIYLLPTHQADIPVSYLMEKAPRKAVDFYDFFSRRNYNPRCENNFRSLCKDLQEIGFEIPKESLLSKLQQAEAKAVTVPAHGRVPRETERG